MVEWLSNTHGALEAMMMMVVMMMTYRASSNGQVLQGAHVLQACSVILRVVQS